jgi:adenine-specific DNA-methyltransferase
MLLYLISSFAILTSEQTAIKKRIKEVGVPLKYWGFSIYRGILTGLNEAFIIDGKKKDELIVKDPKSASTLEWVIDVMTYGPFTSNPK